MVYRLSLLLVWFFVIAPGVVFAGGSDGSEVLVGGKKTKEGSGGLVEHIKEFLLGKKDEPVKKVIEPEYLDCMVTPELSPDYITLTPVAKGNNLIRKPGAIRKARGEYMVIEGKVVDEDCMPVQNAVVQIWQTDAAGKYQDSYALKSEWDIRDKDFDKNFAYSGTAQSNNLGEYSFVTIFPVMVSDERAPHINMKVKHSEYEDLTTMMFFNKHPRNSKDVVLSEMSEQSRQLVIAKGRKFDPQERLEGRIYRFDITLPGISKYKRY